MSKGFLDGEDGAHVISQTHIKDTWPYMRV